MNSDFLGGVVEGFYGQPWTQDQRFRLYDQMFAWGLNTYFYAPKDDLKHRATWRELYVPSELESLSTIVSDCQGKGIRFIYGIGPGLDMRFSDPTEMDNLRNRLEQLLEIGVCDFGLLFDDLPGQITDQDREAFDSIATAHASVANEIAIWLRRRNAKSRLLFCPTPYCNRMDRWNLGGEGYLDTLGRELDEQIDVLWTGPEIISEEITVDSIRQLTQRIGRPPVIWDNLHANDYDMRRLYCGPYAGRDVELKSMVRGILANPNNEFPVNFIAIRTLGEFLSADNYVAQDAYLAATTDWSRHFTLANGKGVDVEDLRLLTDCYYLPFSDGESAVTLCQIVTRLIQEPASEWGNRLEQFTRLKDRIQQLCEHITQLEDRELFYAWSRRTWELREELDLINDFLTRKRNGEDPQSIGCETHLPDTYRGGIVAKLQRKLEMDRSGRFRAAVK